MMNQAGGDDLDLVAVREGVGGRVRPMSHLLLVQLEPNCILAAHGLPLRTCVYDSQEVIKCGERLCHAASCPGRTRPAAACGGQVERTQGSQVFVRFVMNDAM